MEIVETVVKARNPRTRGESLVIAVAMVLLGLSATADAAILARLLRPHTSASQGQSNPYAGEVTVSNPAAINGDAASDPRAAAPDGGLTEAQADAAHWRQLRSAPARTSPAPERAAPAIKLVDTLDSLPVQTH